METQSPGAGPSRLTPPRDIDDAASIFLESRAPCSCGPGAVSRSQLLDSDTSLPRRNVVSIAIQADPVPSSAPKFGPKTDVWCKCQLDPDNGRNLVVCIDGTANQFSMKNTNVVELYSRLDKDKTQLTYYNSGIGTYVKKSNWLGLLKQGLVNGWDMAVAWNLKKIILHAYRWLSENYQPGDCIFLFGFSRGAYQVRIIGGMIKLVGLLHKGNTEQIEFAYELYLANLNNNWKDRSWLARKLHSEASHNKAVEEIQKLCAQFKQTLSHEHATVHFIGVWDTVSSVGIARGPSFPETTNGMKDVCGVRHVLSLDEERDKFQPEYVNGGAGPEEPPESATRLERDRVKEVWFVGSHSDIGGGNSDNIDLNNFGPALRWMIYEALRYGLKIKLSLKGWGAPERNSSMTWVWRILEVYPFRRLTYKDKDSTKRWPPHLCRGRRIQEGQRIHVSVARYMKETPKYVPAARIPSDRNSWPLSWNAVRYDPDISIAYEQDAASPVIDILTQLRDASKAEGGIKEDDLRPLSDLMLLRGGSQSIIDAMSDGSARLLFTALQHMVQQHHSMPSTDMTDAIVSVARALAVIPAIPETEPRYLKASMEVWLEYAEVDHRQKIIEVFSKESLFDPIRGHLGTICCVAYSPDGTYIVSGSGDSIIRSWDAKTGNPFGEPLRGHTNVVTSIAFSPNGEHIASGSYDDTIRLWNVKTQQPIGQPFAGHNDPVTAVAFFPDGKRIVSGSYNETLRIWDTETQRAVGEPLCGHTDWVQSVAVSPDGTRIASGSDDTTVRIWNAETREVIHVLKGHSNRLWSVVFSPDGKRVISGSSDRTIRVWDVETGKMVLGPLSGHEDFVYSVAVSPDGKYIASGSDDETVRLWDAVTGKAVGEPLRGHTNWVRSIAFSPDSRRVVSGSMDITLRIWDIEDHLTRVRTVNNP